MTRTAPAPTGADPYKLVYDDLEFIKESIKKVLKQKNSGSGASAIKSNDVLAMAAREFAQRKGKSFRPMLVLLIGRATDPDFVTYITHSKLAVISEMIHTASLIHADVLEEDETDTSVGTLVHQEVALDVGNKVCILAGDFLLAKAAFELSLLRNSDVTAIVARGLESICEGGMMGFNNDQRKEHSLSETSLESHLAVLEHSVAKLIGNICQSSAILSGHAPDSVIASACLSFGTDLAMAQALVTEAEQMDSLIKKAKGWGSSATIDISRAPKAPLLLALDHEPELRGLYERQGGADSAQLTTLLERTKAVSEARDLAEKYAQSAVEALEALPASATRDSLVVLCHKVITASPLK